MWFHLNNVFFGSNLLWNRYLIFDLTSEQQKCVRTHSQFLSKERTVKFFFISLRSTVNAYLGDSRVLKSNRNIQFPVVFPLIRTFIIEYDSFLKVCKWWNNWLIYKKISNRKNWFITLNEIGILRWNLIKILIRNYSSCLIYTFRVHIWKFRAMAARMQYDISKYAPNVHKSKANFDESIANLEMGAHIPAQLFILWFHCRSDRWLNSNSTRYSLCNCCRSPSTVWPLLRIRRFIRLFNFW